MSLLSAFAIFFIIWWLVFFTVLPIGIRSQADEDNAILGTEHGAPVNLRMKRKVLQTTIGALIVFGIFYWASIVMGWSVDDIPRIVPEFPSRK